jgi:hypothetical protein
MRPDFKERLEYRRSIQDYFATPPSATKHLLRREVFKGQIWEPACGEGWISEVLKWWGYDVLSTDLIDRGYGTGGVDFLRQTRTPRTSPNVLTNPPYYDGLYRAFITHSLKLATGKVAMLLSTQFWSHRRFRALCFDSPLKAIYWFDWPVVTVAEGSKRAGTCNLDAAWFVWDKAYTGQPQLCRINNGKTARLTATGPLSKPSRTASLNTTASTTAARGFAG